MKLNPIRSKWVLPLIQEAADLFMVTPEEVLNQARGTASVVNARQFSMALARHRFKWSYPELGIVFGLDHTTCMSGVKKVERLFPAELARALGAAAAPRPELAKSPAPPLPTIPDLEPPHQALELFERFA